jgi:hypothetical protein
LLSPALPLLFKAYSLCLAYKDDKEAVMVKISIQGARGSYHDIVARRRFPDVPKSLRAHLPAGF